jgi:hypothetical protein
MKVLDVNVLVYAFRPEMKEHDVTRRWLDALVNSGKRFYVPDVVLMGFVRTVTRGPFDPPNKQREAWRFVDALTSLPQCTVAYGSAQHFAALRTLCEQTFVTGNLLTDAYVAAHAVVCDGEVVSWDDDYARFPGLSWRTPLDDQLRTNPR